MEKIATLVQDKKLQGISDLRNESSDRNGTRLVVELKRDAVPQVVLNQLRHIRSSRSASTRNLQ